MGKLGAVLRGAKTLKDKIRTGERWYDEHVAEPLLAEVEEAKEGNLPGEYGSRSSQWKDAVTATARRKADRMIREAAEEYTEELSKVGAMEEKRLKMAQYFIGNLPGGEISGTEVLIVSNTTRVEGMIGPAEPRPEKGSFDVWLGDAWKAFEKADSQSEFKRRIEAIARKPETTLDPDVFQCWESQLGYVDWPSSFWSAYQDEYLERYRRTLSRLEKAQDATQALANEVDALIETKI